MIPPIIPQKYRRPESQPAGARRKPAAAYINSRGAHVVSGQRTNSCRKLTPRDLLLLAVVALLGEEARMLLLLRASSTPLGYAKVDKVDAEEARHLRAQYLIHKVLEEKSPRPSASARALAMARARPRIGVRLKKLRLAVRGLRARACRALQRHLRNLRRLVGHGAQGSPSPS